MTNESQRAWQDLAGRCDRHLHVVGVAGVGMSAIAQALLNDGCRVTGSDRYLDAGDRLEVLDRLERAGCRLVPQDGSAISAETTAVVVSTAIEAGNPDLEAAARFGVPVVHRAAMLARLTEPARTVAVTGTAGKTTVTAMIGWLLEALGADPLVVNGGEVSAWMAPDQIGSVRLGAGHWQVVEADESDGSLVEFHPAWSVITNISKDHFEEAEVVRLFAAFAQQTREGIVCGPGVHERVCGAEPGAGWHEVAPKTRRVDGGWEVEWRGAWVRSPMPGGHNALNALLAMECVHRLGFAPDRIRALLPQFRGVHRRLELVHDLGGIRVIDDYAHNPVKILATWRAASETAQRVVGVWRPHGFRPLAHMFDELVEAFSTACRRDDLLLLLPVFYAGGTAEATVDSRALAKALSARGVRAAVFDGYDALGAEVRGLLRNGDTLLVMGARDPGLSRFAHAVARLV